MGSPKARAAGIPVVIDDTSLLPYAIRFWPEHAHFAGEQFEIIEKQVHSSKVCRMYLTSGRIPHIAAM
jgi:hypothetical protein